MVRVRTKNGVTLFISVIDDCGENRGGYYCQVYLDENDEFEYDNFVINNFDNRTIEECCIAYANEVDDIPIIIERMDEIFWKFSDSYAMASHFYLNHIAFNHNTKQSEKDKFLKDKFIDMMVKMKDAKNLTQEITEHYEEIM